MTDSTETPIPTKSSNRILTLDIFRGFAILGIFMVNILVMNVSFVYRGEWLLEHTDWIDETVYFLLELLFFSKFFPIFSFLFGIGVALQLRNWKAKNTPSPLLGSRRFLALLVFGITHLLFIWSGDILHLYAIFGFLLMLLYRLPNWATLAVACAIFCFPYFGDIYHALCSYFEVVPGTELVELSRSEIIGLKRNGSYTSGIFLRLKEYGFMSTMVVQIIAPVAFTMSILGLYLVKAGIIDRLEAFAHAIRFKFWGLFVLFTTFRFVFLFWMLPNFEIPFGGALSFTLWSLFFVSEIMFSFGYLWIILFLLRWNFWKKILSPLQYVGRMAFTNYILQSVIGYVIMRTFGYYEGFDVVGCVTIVIMVFACQIPLSWYWLKHFKFGPLEWLWRCITYWKILPIRRS